MDGYKRMAWTLGLIFVVTVISAYLNLGKSVFEINTADYRMLFDAGLGAVLGLIVNFASPWIKQYGWTGSNAE